MTDTPKFRELELVELVEDLPEYQVSKGELGVAVEVFDSPTEAHDIEFVDDSGRTSRFAYSVRPDQLRRVEEKTKPEIYEVVEVAEDVAKFGDSARPTSKSDRGAR